MSFVANFIGINKYANQSIRINRCLPLFYFILLTGIGMICFAGSKSIPDLSYFSARKEFKKVYPKYNSTLGISKFLELNWQKLMKI